VKVLALIRGDENGWSSLSKEQQKGSVEIRPLAEPAG
jgi:hypothetical protein